MCFAIFKAVQVMCGMKTRRRLENRNIRKITKMAGGASYGLTLPIEFVRKLGWRERQKVVVSLRGKVISIKDWKK